MKKIELFCIFTVVLFLLSGCATPALIKIVKPNSSIAKTENNGMVFFKVDCEGIVSPVLYFYMLPENQNSQEKPKKVALREKGSFNGNFRFDPTYYLLDMPAGGWRIVRINDPSDDMAYMYGVVGYLASRAFDRKFKEMDVRFDVKHGSVIYLGTFKFVSENRVVELKDIINQEDEAREAFRQDYPMVYELMEKGLATREN